MKCGDCVLGLSGGAVCEKCQGTTFVTETKVEAKPEVKEVKKVLKK